MEKEGSFLDELIQEAEKNEDKQTLAYYDLMLLEIQRLQNQIADNFTEADKEKRIIDDWALRKNSLLQGRVIWLERKLEGFIREEKEKTIDMPNGILKFHKKPDKIEITDLSLFLKKAKPEMLTVIPEQIKPDINKIKAYIKTKPVPEGVTVTEGKEEFTYKLKNIKEVNNNAREEETRTGSEQASSLRIVV